MSYTPTTWAAGDTVTAAKLNKLEQGVASGGGVLVVHYEDGALDKTWQEIHDALLSGGAVVAYTEQDVTAISYVEYDDNYYVHVGSRIYGTAEADGYPSRDGSQ